MAGEQTLWATVQIPAALEESGLRGEGKRQVLAGDWSQRKTRWKEEVPVVTLMGDLSQPRKLGLEESE